MIALSHVKSLLLKLGYTTHTARQRFMKGLSQAVEVPEIIQQVFTLRQKLADFEQRLPSNLKFVSRNLYLHTSNAQRITFIMLQSWWYECHCNLYRFSLPGFRESIDLSSQNATFAHHCQQQVLESAISQSTFWRSIANMDHVLVSDPHILVLVHSNTKTLLAGRKLQAQLTSGQDHVFPHATEISELLTSNVSFLDELAKRVPWVAAGVSSACPSPFLLMNVFF
jgi:hypothetical protein